MGAMAPQRTKPYTTADPLVLRDGAVVEQVVDLHVPGPISDWGQVRSYNSRVQGSGTLDGKWLNVNADYRLRRVGMFVLDLIVDATSKRSFVDSTPAGDALLKFSVEPVNAADVVTNWTTGAVDIFHSVINNSPHPGKLKEKTTLAWRKAGKEGMLYSYNASHQVTQITTGEGQDYNIVFS